jgi:hypothetical protein
MAIGKRRGVGSVRLEGVRRRFECWRRTRSVGTRIPEPLWEAAADVARVCGVSRTASTLRVDYHSLQKRVKEEDAAGSSPANQDAAQSGPRFVELPPPWAGSSECILELEDGGGAKMRVHLKGVAAADLAGLSRSFWSRQS